MATPSLDRLADDGMTFFSFYAQPSCTPRRAAVQTGRRRLAVDTNLGWKGGVADRELALGALLGPGPVLLAHRFDRLENYFLFFFAALPRRITSGTLELELLVTFATVPPGAALPLGAVGLPLPALLPAPAPLSLPL